MSKALKHGVRFADIVNELKIQAENDSKKKMEKVEEVDPQEVFRQLVLDAIKTAFELVTVNGEININVDNIFPLMKTLQLNPNDEPIMDMIRTACIDSEYPYVCN
uniref:Uncharacterized protein n=1 Tax=Magallana gigas TaxID=29159 RepID=A0A8W8N5C3_MAGGI